MKTLTLLSTVLLAASAWGRTPELQGNLGTQAVRQPCDRRQVEKSARPNQILGERFSYTGIAVQAIKADNRLQLLNPAAPAKYGSAEDNVTRDLRTGKVNGLKIFSIEF